VIAAGLVELAIMRNTADARLLRRTSERDRIAQALGPAVTRALQDQ
jgi:N-acetylmuramoyl-L-alanine amidase